MPSLHAEAGLHSEGWSFGEYECPRDWEHHGIKKIRKTKKITQGVKAQET